MHRQAKRHRPLRRLLPTAVLAALLPFAAGAKIEAPDHVLYGNATVFGNPASWGSVIEVRSVPSGDVLARYVIGRNPRLGGQFSLPIPMDTVEPRLAGRARPGDPVALYIGNQLAGETTVGEEGIAVRLDIDPQLLGTGPAVSIADVDMAEGHSGMSTARFVVDMNTTSGELVVLAWETVDGTATGGLACGGDVDYVTQSGELELPAGSLQAAIEVLVCGDTTIEPNETFSVAGTNLQNAVLADGEGLATVRDDDNVPVLDVADARTVEPQAGTATMVFRPRLSRASANDVTVSWSTADGGAQAGADYAQASGTATILAGELETQVGVTVLADAEVEADESFLLLLSAPVNATLARTDVPGTITDPAYDPAAEPREGIGEGQVPQLVQPSGLASSPDGRHVYVTSDAGDAVLVFARDEGAGNLHFLEHYTAASAGFSGALFDGADDVLVSADGAQVYVAARNSDAITVLARDGSTGLLSLVGTAVQGQGGVSGIDGVVALALSPDGQHLYATGRAGNSLAAFHRGDAGALTFLHAVTDDAVSGGTVKALQQPSGVAVSADGSQVYVASRSGNALQVFQRDSASASAGFGRLQLAQVLQDNLLGIDGLAGASDLVLSPDGLHLYVAAEAEDAVVLFDRAADGSLAYRQMWKRGSSGVPGVDGPAAIALTADGSELYVAGFADHSVSIFRRAVADEATVQAGALVPRQTFFDDQGTIHDMAGPTALLVSPDDRNVYAAANIDNAIVVFLRQAYMEVFGDGFDD